MHTFKTYLFLPNISVLPSHFYCNIIAATKSKKASFSILVNIILFAIEYLLFHKLFQIFGFTTAHIEGVELTNVGQAFDNGNFFIYVAARYSYISRISFFAACTRKVVQFKYTNAYCVYVPIRDQFRCPLPRHTDCRSSHVPTIYALSKNRKNITHSTEKILHTT